MIDKLSTIQKIKSSLTIDYQQQTKMFKIIVNREPFNLIKPLILICRYKIMLDCWQENPDNRPTFENLRKDLKEMEY